MSPAAELSLPARAVPATGVAGFRMPAEWEPHRASWLVWPHNRADWEVKTSAIDWCYSEIVRHLVENERVAILFNDASTERRALSCLTKTRVDLSQIESYRVPTNRSWIRDYGPLFVVQPSSESRSAEVALTDWGFNGWGRYRAWKLDNAVPRKMAGRLGLRRFEVAVAESQRRRPIVLEGGSIDVNGEGLMLTTEECLLGSVQARNPGVGREALEKLFSDFLGVRRVLWLAAGISGDDTHGHVDDVARFVSEDTVVVATEADPTDANYDPLQENLARLASTKDLRGRPLTIVPIPMPRPLYFEGDRLPASYLNFYIANQCVLVPTFNDPTDRLALARLVPLFPDRKVVGIHAVELVLGLGTIHCVTQQEPSVD
jgi:agmatine deiminase